MKKLSMKKGLLILMASAFLMVGTSCQETKKITTVGINQFAQHPSLDNCTNGFIEGLKQEGYIKDENIKIDIQNAQADGTKANTISSSFVSKKYDLIAGVATPSAQSAFSATEGKKIPVVFSAVSDPIGAGIVKSLEKPETNATGTSDIINVEAQLKLIRVFLPEAKKIGILYTTSEVNSATQIEKFNEFAPLYGFEIVSKGISVASDIPVATDTILKEVDCITNLTDNTIVTSLPVIIERANASNIPVFGSEIEQLKSGCVASESLDYFKLGIETGKIAARILKGENPSDIPVKLVNETAPVINKVAIEKLGLAVPTEFANAENVETATN